MKFSLSFVLIFWMCQLHGQVITGKIRDKYSFKPLINVKVQSGNRITYSNGQAEFTISIQKSDSLIFTFPSYRQVVLQTDSLEGLTAIFVEMVETSIPIEEVTVKRTKVKRDTFKFKSNLGIAKLPKYREVVLDRSSISNQPKLKSSGSTSSLITIDLLSLTRMLFKRKEKVSTESSMEADELTMQYIDMGFKLELIEELTGLKGDEALVFQNTYRPSIGDYRKMTEIDIRVYIKKCYEEFQVQKIRLPSKRNNREKSH